MGPRNADSEGKAKDYKTGVEGGAPHRAEAFVAIQYRHQSAADKKVMQTGQTRSNQISKRRQLRGDPQNH